jgi:hypothetical protein
MRPDEAAVLDFGTMGAVRGHLLLTNCLEDELTRPNIELALKAEVLCFYAERFLVSVHRDEVPAVADACRCRS